MLIITVFLLCYYNVIVLADVCIPDVVVVVHMVCFYIFRIWSMMLS